MRENNHKPKKQQEMFLLLHPSHQSKLLVEDHLLQQRGLIVEEVRLHVAPHVGEPPELIYILQ